MAHASMVRCNALLLVAGAVVAILCASSATAQRSRTTPLPKPPCNIMGYPGGPLWQDADASCLELNPDPEPPISMPADTATTKYGQIVITVAPGTGAIGSVFVDRNGQNYTIAAAAEPPTDETELRTIWPHLVVEANFTSGSNVVAAYGASVYVPFRTILNVFTSTQFEGVVSSVGQLPSGLSSNTSQVRWSFKENVLVFNPTNKTQCFLNGTFDNLFRSVKDSKGQCRPALCSDSTLQSAPCQYYTQYFGNTTSNLTLIWDQDTSTTAASDPALTLTTIGSRNTWSAPFVQLWQLLKPFKFWPGRNWTFSATFYNASSANSSSFAVPLNFTGSFVNATGVNTTFC